MGKSSTFRSKTPAKEFPLRIASVSLSHFSPPSRMGRVSGYHWQKNSLKETAQQSLFQGILDRKSTRLNSSHVAISYAVFCLKKKKKKKNDNIINKLNITNFTKSSLNRY